MLEVNELDLKLHLYNKQAFWVNDSFEESVRPTG